MFIKFWIGSIIVSVILFYSMANSMRTYVKTKFTEEEWQIIKIANSRKPSNYPWFIYAFIFGCPVLNLLYVLFAGFNYESLYNRIIREYYEILIQENERIELEEN